MASVDYRLCDLCERKAFYDANLNYDFGQRGKNGAAWENPEQPFRVAGEDQSYGAQLDYLGDWAVLCTDCAKTHRTQIVPREAAMQETER